MNKRFKRYKLTDSVKSNGRLHRAYVMMPNGEIRRNFERTTKQWRKEHLELPKILEPGIKLEKDFDSK